MAYPRASLALLPLSPAPDKLTRSCGTDLNFYLAKGMRPLSAPHVLGHESCGVVVSTGPGVKSIKQGDRVAIEPALPCRVCRYCKQGQWK